MLPRLQRFVPVVVPLLLSFVPLVAQTGSPPSGSSEEERLKALLAPVRESIVITATPLAPAIDFRNADAFNQTLFSRDDQVFHLLNAGINAGQHEGGGKSLEIRRFGFNLDHGGVNGGLRVMVDNVPQNYSTQGHGQGYLGALKTLTPELVEEVQMVNGPFSAEYGDFTGLGAVHIRLREAMPDEWTARLQGGSYDSLRGFVAYSPDFRKRDAVFAYEGTHSNGPFLKALDYRRDNITGNTTWLLSPKTKFSLKWNGGRNDFYSSGQIPLDEVEAGRLDRYGSLSAGDGGHVVAGRLGAYYSQDLESGAVLKVDGFLERSLFDLYSNFTFFLNDPANGDGIQQHDSRLSEGATAQYVRPQILDGAAGVLTVGANLLSTQTDVGLLASANRDPRGVLTSAHASIHNGGGYVHENFSFHDGKFTLGGGLRWDVFRFGTRDFLDPQFSGHAAAAELQPKASASYTPSHRLPLKLFFNYGRGISSLDARGVVREPKGPHIATIDFYQAGTTHYVNERFSFLTDFFWIQPSNQLVYIPDDGSIEFAGPSRAYGFEVKTMVQLTPHLSADGGITKVLNAYYTDTRPRVYVDSAPHFTSNAALHLLNWRGWSSSFRVRAINHYRLDGRHLSIVAAGHTVFDFALSRRISKRMDFSLSVDNLFGRDYWETQNYFESRPPGQDPMERIHATPGYGTTVMVGMTIRFGGK